MKAKTILIVDDDEEIRLSLGRFLENKGFRILLAANGRSGYRTYFEENVDLVISDIRMPEIDGLVLLSLIIKNNKNIPVIIITGFSEILETKNAFDLGAKGFLSKPFRMKELLEAVNECLGEKRPIEKQELKYIGINIDEFITGSKINFPIFVKLSEIKYVKIGASGEDISPTRIKKYREKGVDKLYLTEGDHEIYCSLIKRLTGAISNKNINISTNKKVEFMKHANNIIMENVFSNDIDKETFDEAREIIDTTFTVVYKMDHMLKLIESISERSDELYAHSVSVSMLSLMLIKKLGWILEKNKIIITMGALFHDIGKKNLPDSALNKSLIDLTYNDKVEIEKHPAMGAEMLMQIPGIKNEIIEIALQHHENCLGTGYPNKISKHRINPLAKVVSIANEFINIAQQCNKNAKNEDKFLVALRRLIILKINNFDREKFKTFTKLFSFGEEIMREQGYV